jgi:hypothetical protein
MWKLTLGYNGILFSEMLKISKKEFSQGKHLNLQEYSICSKSSIMQQTCVEVAKVLWL